MIYRVLADLVVVVHLAYVLFVIFALVAILLGAVLGWRWTRELLVSRHPPADDWRRGGSGPPQGYVPVDNAGEPPAS